MINSQEFWYFSEKALQVSSAGLIGNFVGFSGKKYFREEINFGNFRNFHSYEKTWVEYLIRGNSQVLR